MSSKKLLCYPQESSASGTECVHYLEVEGAADDIIYADLQLIVTQSPAVERNRTTASLLDVDQIRRELPPTEVADHDVPILTVALLL